MSTCTFWAAGLTRDTASLSKIELKLAVESIQKDKIYKPANIMRVFCGFGDEIGLINQTTTNLFTILLQVGADIFVVFFDRISKVDFALEIVEVKPSARRNWFCRSL